MIDSADPTKTQTTVGTDRAARYSVTEDGLQDAYKIYKIPPPAGANLPDLIFIHLAIGYEWQE